MPETRPGKFSHLISRANQVPQRPLTHFPTAGLGHQLRHHHPPVTHYLTRLSPSLPLYWASVMGITFFLLQDSSEAGTAASNTRSTTCPQSQETKVRVNLRPGATRDLSLPKTEAGPWVSAPLPRLDCDLGPSLQTTRIPEEPGSRPDRSPPQVPLQTPRTGQWGGSRPAGNHREG